MHDLTETKNVQLWLPVENNLWTMKRKHVESDDTNEEGKDLGGKTLKWSVHLKNGSEILTRNFDRSRG